MTPSKVRSMGDLSPPQYDKSLGLDGLRGFARRSKSFGPTQGRLGEGGEGSEGEEKEDDDDEETVMSFVFGDGDILIPAEPRPRKKVVPKNARDRRVSGVAGSGLSRLDNTKGESDSRPVSRMSGVALSSASGNANVKTATSVRPRPSALRSSTLPPATDSSASTSDPAIASTTTTAAITRRHQPRAVSLATTTASANAKFANRLRSLPADRDAEGAYVSEGESVVRRGVGRGSMPPVMARAGSAASNVSAASRLSGPASVKGPPVMGSQPMNRAISHVTNRGNDNKKEGNETIRVRSSSSARQRPWSTTLSSGDAIASGTSAAVSKRASTPASAVSMTIGRRSITPLSATSPTVTAHPIKTAASVTAHTTKTGAPVTASTISTRASSRMKPGVSRGRMSTPPSTVANANTDSAASGNTGARAGISAATAARRARVSSLGPRTSTGTLTPSLKANPGAAAKAAVKPNTTASAESKPASAESKPAPASTLRLAPKPTITNGRATSATGVKPIIRAKGTPSPSPSPSVRTTASTCTRTSTRTPQRKGIPTMSSMDTALVEVWKEYGNVDIDKLGSSTPGKAVPKEKAETPESVKAPAGVRRVPAVGGGGRASGLDKSPVKTPGSVRNKAAPVRGRIGEMTKRRDVGEKI